MASVKCPLGHPMICINKKTKENHEFYNLLCDYCENTMRDGALSCESCELLLCGNHTQVTIGNMKFADRLKCECGHWMHLRGCFEYQFSCNMCAAKHCFIYFFAIGVR